MADSVSDAEDLNNNNNEDAISEPDSTATGALLSSPPIPFATHPHTSEWRTSSIAAATTSTQSLAAHMAAASAPVATGSGAGSSNQPTTVPKLKIGAADADETASVATTKLLDGFSGDPNSYSDFESDAFGLQAPRGGPSHARMNGASAAATASSSAGRFAYSSYGHGGATATGLGSGLGSSLGTGLGISSKPPMYPGSSAFGLGLGGYGLSAPTASGGAGALGTASATDYGIRRRSSNPLLDDDMDSTFELESTVAEKVNEQYREILKNKPIGPSRIVPSDTESIKTEDFANKFNLGALNPPAGASLTRSSFLTQAGPSAMGARGGPLLASGMSDASTAKLLGPMAPAGTGFGGAGGLYGATGSFGFGLDHSASSAAAPGATSTLTLGRSPLGLRTYSPQPTLRASERPSVSFTPSVLTNRLSYTFSSGASPAANAYSSKPSAGAGAGGPKQGAPKLDGTYQPLALGGGGGGGRSFTPDPSLSLPKSSPSAGGSADFKGAYANLLRSTPTPPRADSMSKSTGLAAGAGQSTAYRAGPTLGLGASGTALDGGVRSRDIKREAERIMNELEIERRKKQMLASAAAPAAQQTSLHGASGAASASTPLQLLSSKSLLSQAGAPASSTSNGFLGSIGYGSARATTPAACPPTPPAARFEMRSSTGPTARQQLETRLSELEDLNREVKHLRGERESIREEVEKLRNVMKEMQNSQMKFASERRDELGRDMEALNGQMTRKKAKLDELEDLMRRRVRELQELESLGLTRADIEAVIAERNELMEMIRTLEEHEAERYELKKQVYASREEIASEQKKFQSRISGYEGVLSQTKAQVEEAARDNSMLQEQIRARDAQIRALEEEREKLMQSHAASIEGYGKQLQQELNAVQEQGATQSGQMRAHLVELEEHMAQQAKELEWKNQLLAQLGEEKRRLHETVAEERQDLEQRKKVNENVKNEELSRMMEALEKDKQAFVAELQGRLEEERQRAAADMQRKLAEELEQRDLVLKEKEKEAMVLRDKVRHLEASSEQIKARVTSEVKDEVSQQVQSVIEHERRRWQNEHEEALMQLHNEVVKQKLERERALAKLSEQLERSTKTLEERDTELRAAHQELEREREGYKGLSQEKMSAVAKAKEEAKQWMQAEVAKSVEGVKREKERELAQVREAAAREREASEALQAKLGAAADREKEYATLLSKLARSVVHELNEECRLNSQLVGVTPKLVDVSSLKPSGPEQLAENKQMITTAIATLKACSQQIREHAKSVTKELDTAKLRLTQSEDLKGAEIEKMIADMQLAKQRELDLLREKLTKNYTEEINKLSRGQGAQMESVLREKDEEMARVKANLAKWKEETAAKIAAAMHDEFKAEWERKMKELRDKLGEKDSELTHLKRELEHIKMRSPKQDDSAAKVISQLQEHLKQLREENLGLHQQLASRQAPGPHGSSASTSDLLAATAPISHSQPLGGSLPVSAKPSRTSSMERLGGLAAPPVSDSRSEILQEDSALREKQLQALQRDYNLLRSKLHGGSGGAAASSGLESGSGSRGSSGSGRRAAGANGPLLATSLTGGGPAPASATGPLPLSSSLTGSGGPAALLGAGSRTGSGRSSLVGAGPGSPGAAHRSPANSHSSGASKAGADAYAGLMNGHGFHSGAGLGFGTGALSVSTAARTPPVVPPLALHSPGASGRAFDASGRLQSAALTSTFFRHESAL